MTPSKSIIPYGYCHCGCGQQTHVDFRKDPFTGAVRTKPREYLKSHRKFPRKPGTLLVTSQTTTYNSWKLMKARCKPNHSQAKDYYDRGIRVCERWNKFPNFLEDMGEKPRKSLTLDRINNDGNYEPGNCRWATRKQQMDNRRNNVRVVYRGQIVSLEHLCKISGIKRPALYERIVRKGMDAETALSKPLRPWGINAPNRRTA